MNTFHSTKRTDPEAELLVVTRIAQGVRQIDISEETAMPVSTIKKISARNQSLIAEIKQQTIKKEAAIVASNLQKTLRLMSQRLDRALADEEDISSKDLVSISKEMHNQLQAEQVKSKDESPNQPSPEQLEALKKAIQLDDTVMMTKILFNKNEVGT
jgi:hypothetical protein